jgi:ribosomal protein S19E (S16A)
LGGDGFFLWEERPSRGGASKEEAEEKEPQERGWWWIRLAFVVNRIWIPKKGILGKDSHF